MGDRSPDGHRRSLMRGAVMAERPTLEELRAYLTGAEPLDTVQIDRIETHVGESAACQQCKDRLISEFVPPDPTWSGLASLGDEVPQLLADLPRGDDNAQTGLRIPCVHVPGVRG